MKTYQYQILSIQPDRVTGEFANVAVVFFCREAGYLNWRFVKDISRIEQFFPEHNLRPYFRHLIDLEGILPAIQAEIASGKRLPKSIVDVTNELFSPDDSVFSFSKIHQAIAPELGEAFDYLVTRYFEKHISKMPVEFANK